MEVIGVSDMMPKISYFSGVHHIQTDMSRTYKEDAKDLSQTEEKCFKNCWKRFKKKLIF